MITPTRATLLRVFVGDSDRLAGQPLYEAIVRKARELQLAGATVLHGQMGFGARSVVHTAKILRLSEDLPVVIEIVDSEANIDRFLPELGRMIGDGLVTRESVDVIHYRAAPRQEDAR